MSIMNFATLHYPLPLKVLFPTSHRSSYSLSSPHWVECADWMATAQQLFMEHGQFSVGEDKEAVPILQWPMTAHSSLKRGGLMSTSSIHDRMVTRPVFGRPQEPQLPWAYESNWHTLSRRHIKSQTLFSDISKPKPSDFDHLLPMVRRWKWCKRQ